MKQNACPNEDNMAESTGVSYHQSTLTGCARDPLRELSAVYPITRRFNYAAATRLYRAGDHRGNDNVEGLFAVDLRTSIPIECDIQDALIRVDIRQDGRTGCLHVRGNS